VCFLGIYYIEKSFLEGGLPGEAKLAKKVIFDEEMMIRSGRLLFDRFLFGVLFIDLTHLSIAAMAAEKNLSPWPLHSHSLAHWR
jgi:hypothetical protein